MNEDAFLATIDAYDRTRQLADKGFWSLCYAPFTSLYFDQMGEVRVCCHNASHPVGNIQWQSLDEIWRGDRINALRDALVAKDLRKGCRFCEWQLLNGNTTGTFMRRFDEFPVADPRPDFPSQMEFSISNTCNLECRMCNGDWSSTIRSRREKKPPLPKVYGDRFFDELRVYLPHLRKANFLGGEPFLAQETLRIWDAMIDMKLDIACHVTTNGTQYSDRVERILRSLPLSLTVSIDAATKATYESIRKNASFDDVMANFHRFRDYVRKRGTYIGVAHCLMTANWREFADLLSLADQWDCDVCVNTVTNPNDMSLYMLPKDQLENIVREMNARNDDVLGRLVWNRKVWIEELARLTNHLKHFDKASRFEEWGRRFPDIVTGDLAAVESDLDKEIRASSGGPPVAIIDGDRQQTVIALNVRDSGRFAVAPDEIVGKNINEMQRILTRLFGWDMRVIKHEQSERCIDSIVSFDNGVAPAVELRGLSFPVRDSAGLRVGTRTLIGVRRPPPPTVVTIQTPAS